MYFLFGEFVEGFIIFIFIVVSIVYIKKNIELYKKNIRFSKYYVSWKVYSRINFGKSRFISRWNKFYI